MSDDKNDKIKALELKLNIAIKALTFYADSHNWISEPAAGHPDCMDFIHHTQEKYGGDRARQALQWLKGKDQ